MSSAAVAVVPVSNGLSGSNGTLSLFVGTSVVVDTNPLTSPSTSSANNLSLSKSSSSSSTATKSFSSEFGPSFSFGPSFPSARAGSRFIRSKDGGESRRTESLEYGLPPGSGDPGRDMPQASSSSSSGDLFLGAVSVGTGTASISLSPDAVATVSQDAVATVSGKVSSFAKTAGFNGDD